VCGGGGGGVGCFYVVKKKEGGKVRLGKRTPFFEPLGKKKREVQQGKEEGKDRKSLGGPWVFSRI